MHAQNVAQQQLQKVQSDLQRAQSSGDSAEENRLTREAQWRQDSATKVDEQLQKAQGDAQNFKQQSDDLYKQYQDALTRSLSPASWALHPGRLLDRGHPAAQICQERHAP